MPDDLPILDFVAGGPVSLLIATLVWTVVVVLVTKWYVVRRASKDIGYVADLAAKFARAKAKADGFTGDLTGLELKVKAAVANAAGAFEVRADKIAADIEALKGKLAEKVEQARKKD